MTKDAFIREVRDAEAMLYHISKSILKNDSDCGDAVQETILKAYEKLPTLKKEKYFRTWITRILINECKGILRKRKNVIPYEEYMDNMRLTEEDRYSHLYMAIMELPEEQQETLQESTYIQNIDQSVTQNGVTVTLTDSVQDQGFLYAFFEVKTDDNISMTDNTSFEEMTHFKIDGKEVYADDDNRFGSLSTGVSQDNLLNYEQDSAHSKYFTAGISYDSDYDLSNKTVEITLKNLTEEGDYDKTVITDGTWDFKWTLGAVKPPTTLEVNRKCDFGGYEITVKKMEVTPLLWSLYLDYDEAMKVYEDEKNKFEYAGTDYGMDLYDRTNIDQVRYKDGTVLTLDLTMGGIAGGGEKQDKENGVLIIRNSFPQLVDVDNLQAVHFGNIDQWLEVRE